MQRWKKRLWSSTLVGGSVLLIIAAVLMGAVRLVDLAAPKYRQLLANKITEAIEQPVEVGGIGMSWRRLRPTVDLTGVVILHPDNRLPVFELESIQVPFKWSALVRGEFEPAEVILTGVALTLEWRADGSLGVKGIEILAESDASEELDLTAVFAQLRQLGRVTVRDSELAWLELGGPADLDHISNVNAELLATESEYSLEIEARLPESLGDELRLQAFVQGEADQLEKLRSSIEVQVDGLAVQGWLQQILQPDMQLRGGPARVDIRSQWQGLQPLSAKLYLEAPPQASWRGDELHRELPGVTAELSLEAADEGWQAIVESLQYQDVRGPSPVSSGRLAYQPLAGGFGDSLSGELDVVRVRDLLAWSSILAPSAQLPIPAEAGGELQQLEFSYKRRPVYEPELQLTARLQDLSMPVTGPLPGISGLNGALQYDSNGARIELSSQEGELVLPQVFANPVPLTRFKSRLLLEPNDKGWQLSSETLSLQAQTVQAQGRLALTLFNDQQLPDIDLKLDFSASDVMPAKSLIPVEPILPVEVSEWLDGAILGGEVPQGEFVLRGPLGAFPYTGEDKGKGEFRVEFDVKNCTLEYAPDWPRVTEVSGHAIFAGQSMRIKSEAGKILDVPVSDVQAIIEDFEKPDLRITGRVEADLGQQLAFLGESPLREDYQSLIDNLKISGPGALDLVLKLPLEDLDKTTVSGVVQLQGGKLDFAGLPYPVTDLQGKVKFTADGLKAQGVTGRFLDVPGQVDLQPYIDTQGMGTQLNAALELSLPQHEAALKELIGDDLPLGHFSGTTTVNVETRISPDGETSKLRIRSDLRGMTSTLGAPLNKAADDRRSLRLGVLPGEERVLLDWDYVGSLHGQLEMLPEGESWRLNRGVLRLGQLEEQAVPALPDGPGWDIQGDLPLLDLENLERNQAGELPRLRALDVHVGLLKVAQQRIRDIRVQLSETGDSLKLSGADTEGVVSWAQKTGRMQVDADFRRLVLTAPKKLPGQTETQPEVMALDPASLPGLDLQIQQLILGDEVLGQLDINILPVNNGLKLQTFVLNGKKLKLQGSGEWLRDNGLSSGKLQGNFTTDDITDILKAMGYVPNIVAESAKGSLDIHWAPDEAGLKTEALNGSLGFEFKNGSLLAVEPGAGRVLSLISFYSIPRRLSLDFSDVMGKGTAFDKLDGNFRIEDGNAFTRNLDVESPSMEIDVEGRVGLAARDYDQVVTIQPKVSASVALAGAVLGGPVLGIGLWLAQELLDEPLEQASVLVYRLHGSWEDPVIEPVKAKPVKAGKGQSSQSGKPASEKTTQNPEEAVTGPR